MSDIGKKFGIKDITTLPTTFIISPDGKITQQLYGPQTNALHVTETVPLLVTVVLENELYTLKLTPVALTVQAQFTPTQVACALGVKKYRQLSN